MGSYEHTPAARALRALQKLDELEQLKHRHLLIEAETALGEELDLECTGEPDGWNADGSIALYSHNSDTCPVHEWLVEADGAEIHEQQRRETEETQRRTGLAEAIRRKGNGHRSPVALYRNPDDVEPAAVGIVQAIETEGVRIAGSFSPWSGIARVERWTR